MKSFPRDERYQIMVALLRKIRKDEKLYQSDIAKQIGKPQSFVSKYETGERRIDPVELYMICGALGTSLSDFARRYEKALQNAGL